MVPITHFYYLAMILFLIGLLGVSLRRELLVVLLSAEMMVGAASLVLVAASRSWTSVEGQALSFVVTFVALAQLLVGISVMLHRRALSRDVQGGPG